MQIPDLLIERKKLNKSLTTWKGLTALVLIFLSWMLYTKYSGSHEKAISISTKKDYIAEIKLEGFIYDDQKYYDMLDEIATNEKIKAVIVNINSPGGISASSELIYKKLLKIKQKRPVISVISSIGASGAYLSALASDKIYVLNMTLTGSIGVLAETAEVVELANKLGIKFKNYKSSPLKGTPNPTEINSPEADGAIMDTINDSYNYFIELVMLNRKMDKDTALKVCDGRVYSGRQALTLKLIDEIGSKEDAIEWVKKEKNLDPDIEVKEVEPKRKYEFLDTIIDNLSETASNFIMKTNSTPVLLSK